MLLNNDLPIIHLSTKPTRFASICMSHFTVKKNMKINVT